MTLARCLMLLVVATLGGCATTEPSTEPTSILASPNDARTYRYLKLDNQLKVLLISDLETDKSAASLTVFRGSMHEPDGYPGLAHFLEHMLFIGTEKYPQPDGYQRYVATHGGSTNAYTALDHTNYFFDINPAAFPEALDRFAQFFVAPLLQAEYVDREKNAVHSEYQLQLKEDGWRSYMAEKQVINPEHPASRFTIGTLGTLGDGVREALFEFFETNYSANQMALAVLTNETLDEMESWITPIFRAVENRELGPGTIEARAYPSEALPVTLYYRPLKELRTISYAFPIPASRPHYLAKPEGYITNFLGHEGPGSLYRELTDRGWAQSLYAGFQDLDADEGTIEVVVELTPTGVEHTDEITDLLFAYINMLREAPAERWRYDEVAETSALNFQFLESPAPMRYVYALTPNMMRFPPEHLLAHSYLMEQYDPVLIERTLANLTPDNVLISIQHPDVETDSREPYFGVAYAVDRSALSIAPVADANLALPAPNPFLPQDLELVSGQDAQPRPIATDKPANVWLATDTEFGVPRANVRLQLAIDGGVATPDDRARTMLYARLVTDALGAQTYASLLAGLSYQLTPTSVGFELGLAGYNDKQPELADMVLDAMINLEIDPARFDLIKRALLEDLDNSSKDRPFNQASRALSDAVVDRGWPDATIADALAPLTVDELMEWRDEKVSGVGLRALLHGNVTDDTVGGFVAAVDTTLGLDALVPIPPTPTPINDAYSLELPVDHTDAAFVAYVQDADTDWQTRSESALTAHILRQPYFSSLRTEQQLGYVVALGSRVVRGLGSVVFIVQSPVAGPTQILDATRAFLDEQQRAVAAMDDAEFEASRAGLVGELTESDKNLASRTRRYWQDLDLDVLTFDSKQQIAAAVGELEKADVLEVIDRLARQLDEESLIVYSRGQFEPLEHGTQIDSVDELKTLTAR